MPTTEPQTSRRDASPSLPTDAAAISASMRTSRAPGAVGRFLLSAIQIPLFPLIFVAKRLIFRVGEKQGMQIVSFTSFSAMVYSWPIWGVGFICYALSGWVDGTLLGWIWIAAIVATLVLYGTDINRNSAIMWLLAIGLVLAVGALLNARANIPVLGWIWEFFASLNVRFDPGTGLALSILTFVVFLVVVVQALFDGCHEISSREVTHRRFMRTNENIPLGLNRVLLDWPDIMEMVVLFGAGSLVIIDQDRRELMRIPNIPFLWFFRDEVNGVLDVMATTHVPESALPVQP